MRVIEQHLQGKAPDPALCEDIVVVTDHFAAVIDGATDKTGWRLDGKTSGRVAAEVIATTIEEDLHAHVDAYTAIGTLNAALRPVAAQAPASGPVASVAIYSHFRSEVWQVGDCNYLLPASERAGSGSGPVLVDSATAAYRAAVIHAELLSGADTESACEVGRQAILPVLLQQYRFQNHPTHPWGYGVIDGGSTPHQYVIITPLLPMDQELVLASDGYPEVLGTLAESESVLSRCLAADPLCIGELLGTKPLFPGNASFDDRSYLRLSVDTAR